jgi:hypothetical protein
MRFLPIVSVIIALLLLSAAYAGEVSTAYAGEATGSVWRKLDMFPFPGIKYDSTMGPAVSVALLKPQVDPKRRCGDRFWIAQTELGLGGGKLELGSAALQMGGGAVKLSMLQTWGEPGHAKPNQTYIGSELELNLTLVNLNAGLYGHVIGKDRSHNCLLTLGVGLGF